MCKEPVINLKRGAAWISDAIKSKTNETWKRNYSRVLKSGSDLMWEYDVDMHYIDILQLLIFSKVV